VHHDLQVSTLQMDRRYNIAAENMPAQVRGKLTAGNIVHTSLPKYRQYSAQLRSCVNLLTKVTIWSLHAVSMPRSRLFRSKQRFDESTRLCATKHVPGSRFGAPPPRHGPPGTSSAICVLFAAFQNHNTAPYLQPLKAVCYLHKTYVLSI